MHNPFRERVTILGETVGRTAGRHFGIYQSDRLFHMFILGQTGTGKSTLLKNMMHQDLEMGHGFALLDPHGDLAEAVKSNLGENAIYWDIADPDCSYGYNPLTYVSEKYRPLVASAIIEALKKQWADAWGVRMEHLLRFAILALLSRHGSSFADIVPMFTKKGFRSQVLQSVTNEEVLKFWREEFPNMNYKGAFDGVAPIANKLGAFLSNSVVKKVLCEPEQPLRFRQIMDEGTPLVINLSKGRLGSDVSGVLGGLILSMMAGAAFTRQNIPEQERQPYMIYADEFANFTTGTIAGMLSELRKFNIGLVLAAQYTAGIKTSILEAIFGNVGNLFIFRSGALDAPLLTKQLGGRISPEDVTSLPNFRNYSKIMANGERTKAFSARTIRKLV